ncbi:MAG: WGxxGxxG-CTERM domain-containing protein [Acidobacteriales bacterium]|nr:WGxxGxxG-CTERM domain-containing protein [Terriglobales bacterium]
MFTFVIFVCSLGFGQSSGQPSTSDPNRSGAMTTNQNNDDHHDYGWLGLVGLAGLAGLTGRRRDVDTRSERR